MFTQRNRVRTRNAPLRAEIEAQVCYETTLDRASILGTGGFGGTRGYWISLRGPKRLVVGTDAFMISAPQAFREFAFTGQESFITFTQAPSRLVDRDWIVITGQSDGRQVQLAITRDNLLDVWQALAGTGAVPMGDDVPRDHLTTPQGRPVRSRRYSLRRLAAALVIVLVLDAAAWLAAIAVPALDGVCNVGLTVAVVMFFVWFYRARVNADGHGWPQRRPPGWAVWAWLIPVGNFWFPFEIMTDIWRAGLPAQERAKRGVLPGVWWICILALLALPYITARPANLIYGRITGVLAATMTALLVQKVSSSPLGQETEPLA